jgi:hypothetical protein
MSVFGFLPGVYLDDAITSNVMLREYIPKPDAQMTAARWNPDGTLRDGVSPLWVSETIWKPYISSNKNPIQSVKQITANVASMRRNARNSFV